MHDEDHIKDELVAAASSYFLRFGYSRVSTGEIATSVGRSKKTLYKHFPSKEQLLHAVLVRINQRAEEAAAAALQTADLSRPETLQTLLHDIAISVISSQQLLMDDLQHKANELYQNHDEQQRQALVELLLPLFRRGVATGSLRGDIDYEDVVTIFVQGLRSLVRPLDLTRQETASQRHLELFIRLLVAGLRPAPHP
ncbi:MAG: TetR/AcrR family transcriptional regulator [Planctomycetota bacterium]